MKKIFNLKTSNDRKYKLLTLCGKEFKFKRKKYLYEKTIYFLEKCSHQKSLPQDTSLLFHIENIAKIQTAEFIIQNMPNAKIKKNKQELLLEALNSVSNDGLYLEFGVFSGNTINYIASQVPQKTIFGFDSFEGLPETWRSGFEKGTFYKKELPKVKKNVELIKGWFDETLPVFLNNNKNDCAFIHIDCDLYSSTKTIFTLLKDRIKSGTIILFDEYFAYTSWQEHEHKAFMEFIHSTRMSFEFIAYNSAHQQCAVIIL